MRRLATFAVLAACGSACGLEPPPKASPPAQTTAASAPAMLPPAKDPWAHAGWVRPAADQPPATASLAPAAAASPAPSGVTTDSDLPKNLAGLLVPAPPTAVVATHAAMIRSVAAVDDGSAAVTVDFNGRVRLWPRLDGTREPVVVTMRAPGSVAVALDHDAIVIAGLDGAGQLELVHVSLLGEPRDRADVELARPAIAVHATPRGFIVERDDQHLTFVSFNAFVTGELEPAAGEHIAAVASRGNAALALLDRAGEVHGRWLSFGQGFAWGDETPALPIRAGAFALSANHRKIAGIHATRTTSRLTVVDVLSGERVDNGPDFGVVDQSLGAIGFLDADTVVFEMFNEVQLWHVGRTDDDGAIAAVIGERRGTPPAVAGGRALVGDQQELMIVDPADDTRYLGFHLPIVASLVPSGRDFLATDNQSVVRITTQLRDRAAYRLTQADGQPYAVLAILDGNHVLVQSYNQGIHLATIALDTMADTAVDGDDRFAGYDPASRFAAFTTDKGVRFRRFDAKTGTFGDAAFLATGLANSTVVFAQPGTTAGAIAQVTTTTETQFTVYEIHDIRPERAKDPVRVLRKTTHSIKTQPNGFIESPVPATTLALLRPSPDGTVTAEVTGGRIVLRAADGTTRWAAPARGATDVVWSRGGDLIAYGNGMAKVDVATGAFTERRCGWQFGMWEQRTESAGAAAICEAE